MNTIRDEMDSKIRSYINTQKVMFPDYNVFAEELTDIIFDVLRVSAREQERSYMDYLINPAASFESE